LSDRKISQLALVGSLTGTELVPVVQGGVTKAATAAQLGSGGVQSVVAGTNVTVTGTAANPVVNSAGAPGPAGPAGGSGSLLPSQPLWLFQPPALTNTTLGVINTNTLGGFIYDSVTTTQVDTWYDSQNSPPLALSYAGSGSNSFGTSTRYLQHNAGAYLTSGSTTVPTPTQYYVATVVQWTTNAPATQDAVVTWGGNNGETLYGAAFSGTNTITGYVYDGTTGSGAYTIANAFNVPIAFLLYVNGANAYLYYSLNGTSWTNAYGGGLPGNVATSTWSPHAQPDTGPVLLHRNAAGGGNSSATVMQQGLTGLIPGTIVVTNSAGTASTNLLSALWGNTPQPNWRIGSGVGDIASDQNLMNQLNLWKAGSGRYVNVLNLPNGKQIPSSGDVTTQIQNALNLYGNLEFPPGNALSGGQNQNADTSYSVSSPLIMAEAGAVVGRNTAFAAIDFGSNIYGVNPLTNPLPVFDFGNGNSAQPPNTAEVRGIRVHAHNNIANNAYTIGCLVSNKNQIDCSDVFAQNAYWGWVIEAPQYNRLMWIHATNNQVAYHINNPLTNGTGMLDVSEWGPWYSWNLTSGGGSVNSGIGFLFTLAQANFGSPLTFRGLYSKLTSIAIATVNISSPGTASPTPLRIRYVSSENAWAGQGGEDEMIPATYYSYPTATIGGAGTYNSGSTYTTGQSVYFTTGPTNPRAYTALQNVPVSTPPAVLQANNPAGLVNANPTYWAPYELARAKTSFQIHSCLVHVDSQYYTEIDDFWPYDGYVGVCFSINDGGVGKLNSGQFPGNWVGIAVRAYGPRAAFEFGGDGGMLPLNNGNGALLLENVRVRPNGIKQGTAFNLNSQSGTVSPITMSSFAAETFAGEWAQYIPGQAISITPPGSGVNWTNPTFGPVLVTITGDTTTAITVGGATVPLGMQHVGVVVAAGAALNLTYSAAGTWTYAQQIATLHSAINSQGNGITNRFLPTMTAGGSGSAHVSVSTATDTTVTAASGTYNGETFAGSPPFLPASSTVVNGLLTFDTSADPVNTYAYTAFLAGAGAQTTFTDMNGGGGDNGSLWGVASLSFKLVSAQPSIRIMPSICSAVGAGARTFMVGCDPKINKVTNSVSLGASPYTFNNPSSNSASQNFPIVVTFSGGTGVSVSGSNLQQIGVGPVSGSGPTNTSYLLSPYSFGGANSMVITYTGAPTVTWTAAVPQALTLWQGFWMPCPILWFSNKDGSYTVSLHQTPAATVQILYRIVLYSRKRNTEMQTFGQIVRDLKWI
jgi:hypothetical protein